jgi:hypothetical protein
MYTTHQVKLLRELGPHYHQAIQQKREEDFFQQAYACWFDIFPERRGDKDHDEFEWALRVSKRVHAHFSMRNSSLISTISISAYSAWIEMDCVAVCPDKLKVAVLYTQNLGPAVYIHR